MDQRDRKCGADFIFLTLSLFRNFHESTLQVSVVLIMMLIWVTQGKSVPSWYVCTEKQEQGTVGKNRPQIKTEITP